MTTIPYILYNGKQNIHTSLDNKLRKKRSALSVISYFMQVTKLVWKCNVYTYPDLTCYLDLISCKQDETYTN